MSDPVVAPAPTTNGNGHPEPLNDVKHAPTHAGPAPHYEHNGDALTHEKPTVDITNDNANITGQPTVMSPITSPNSPSRAATAHERAATAESSMSNAAKVKIGKNEVKDAKRMSKVLKDEGRSEDKTLKTAIKELERLSKVHKQASKDESSAISAHSKAIKVEHKLNMRFLAARTKYEGAAADTKAKEEALNATKSHVKNQGELLKEKEREVEEMRSKKALDDREREAKLTQLQMSPT